VPEASRGVWLTSVVSFPPRQVGLPFRRGALATGQGRIEPVSPLACCDAVDVGPMPKAVGADPQRSGRRCRGQAWGGRSRLMGSPRAECVVNAEKGDPRGWLPGSSNLLTARHAVKSIDENATVPKPYFVKLMGKSRGRGASGGGSASELVHGSDEHERIGSVTAAHAPARIGRFRAAPAPEASGDADQRNES